MTDSHYLFLSLFLSPSVIMNSPTGTNPVSTPYNNLQNLQIDAPYIAIEDEQMVLSDRYETEAKNSQDSFPQQIDTKTTWLLLSSSACGLFWCACHTCMDSTEICRVVCRCIAHSTTDLLVFSYIYWSEDHCLAHQSITGLP